MRDVNLSVLEKVLQANLKKYKTTNVASVRAYMGNLKYYLGGDILVLWARLNVAYS